MKFISGKKLSMTQIWSGDEVIAVTPVQAGPCVITQVKTKAKDGYEALQLAYGVRKEKNIKKPQLGHYKASGVKPMHVREFKIEDSSQFKVGDVVTVEAFAVKDTIDVTGTSKGKGFQGVVKRHHFHGFRKTHGNKDQERMPGSIGPKGPAHVFKGTRMGGRMGGEKVTTTNLEVVAIDAEKDIIFVKGAVPGAINGFVMIKGEGNLQVNLKKAAPAEAVPEAAETKTEEPAAEEAKPEIAAEAKPESAEEAK
jgi:large subunit ribosomal protein L3